MADSWRTIHALIILVVQTPEAYKVYIQEKAKSFVTCLFATISFLHFSSLQAKIHSVERITIKLVHKHFCTKMEIPKKR